MSISEPSRETLSRLLADRESRLVIPTYQRSYSWAREQVGDLISDIERFEERTGDTDEYFAGAIVVVAEGKKKRILDGQQRLATITILLAAIRDALSPLDEEAARLLNQDLIANPRKKHDFKLELGLYDKDFFERYVQAHPPEPMPKKVQRPSHKLIREAATQCRDWVQRQIEGSSQDEAVRYLERLEDILGSRLVFVQVSADSEEDATDVFEVLNERGIGLSVLDLLRNFLLGRANGPDEQERIARYWTDVFDVSERPAQVNRFLRHFWISRHGDVKSRGLYREIKAELAVTFEQPGSGRNDPVNFSNDLSSAASLYRDLLVPPESFDPELRKWLGLVSQFDATSIYPVLLASAEKHGEKGCAVLAEALLADFVRWSVIGRRESTDLERRFFDLAKAIWLGQDVATSVAGLRDASTGDPEFTVEFQDAAITKPAWRKGLLLQLEAHLRALENSVLEDAPAVDALNVEHVYPQNPQKSVWAELENHAEIVDRLGNLTLVNWKTNSVMQNRDFVDVKKPKFQESRILLNGWIAEQEVWGEDEIAERQSRLAALAAEIWSFPRT